MSQTMVSSSGFIEALEQISRLDTRLERVAVKKKRGGGKKEKNKKKKDITILRYTRN